MMERIYVLHEYGAPSHYNALVELGRKEGFDVRFRVFTPKSILGKIYRRQYALGFDSIGFLLSLPFRKPVKIVLGIAPFNGLLKPLCLLLRKHQVYYHTSYTHWDGLTMAHPTSSISLMNLWRAFLSQKVRHTFAVSEKTRQELTANRFVDANKISVVNHSYLQHISAKPAVKNNSFIFVGRMTECKGIQELLDIFAKRPDTTLTLVGSGNLVPLIQEYCSRFSNINYVGYVKGLNNLIPIYEKHSFIVMNSQRMDKWEELFGISIIEGMACGCVPLTTDHPGPCEILIDNENGFISKEREIESIIDRAISLNDKQYQLLRFHAVETAGKYQSSKIAERWRPIIE